MERTNRKLVSGMLVSLLINATACATELQKGNPLNTYNFTLWQLIETLIELPSYTLDTIKPIFPVELSERHRSAYTSFYEGGPVYLTDRVMIETINLGIRHENGVSRWLGLDLGPNGTCVKLDDVYLHYPNITIIDTPRGKSLDEATYWAIKWPWGRLAFGFKERNRECLASVGIRRNDPPPAPTGE